jgi:lysophospholipase L1-like esterase
MPISRPANSPKYGFGPVHLLCSCSVTVVRLGILFMGSLLVMACNGSKQSEQDQTPPAASTLVVRGEARVLRATESVLLLHPVQRVLAVYSYDQTGRRIDYQEKLDWQAEGTRLMRTAASRIPDFDTYTYTASNDARFEFSAEPRNPGLTINYVVYFDYASNQQDVVVRSKSPQKEHRKTVCLGDSIAAGAHTISSYYRNEDSDSWCGLLRTHVGKGAVVINRSVPGGVLRSVWADPSPYVADQPDLVILAFGMNDHVAGVSALPEFSRMLDEVVASLLSRNMDVILVGFFQQNPLWLEEDPAMTMSYNDAIRSVASARSVPFIDAYSAFQRVSAGSEPYYHLTADFMHHPNNFGQRIYFSLLVPYFLRQDAMASSIPNFIVSDW